MHIRAAAAAKLMLISYRVLKYLSLGKIISKELEGIIA